MTRVGVVGHAEWVDFAVCPRLPRPGEILEAAEGFSLAAGGGAVAAVQLARLAGEAFLVTALGDDRIGDLVAVDLVARGLHLEAVRRAQIPQRRAWTWLTDDHERTITTVGRRLAPEGDHDALDWSACARADAIYLTAGDAAAVSAARRARVLVATPRARAGLVAARTELDVLVGSASDPGEAVDGFEPAPRVVVLTEGARGGRWRTAEGDEGRWAPAPLPGPPVDAYGCGDSFAAGLTYGLGAGLKLEAALALAARCGAACLTGRGPYAAQLTAAEL